MATYYVVKNDDPFNRVKYSALGLDHARSNGTLTTDIEAVVSLSGVGGVTVIGNGRYTGADLDAADGLNTTHANQTIRGESESGVILDGTGITTDDVLLVAHSGATIERLTITGSSGTYYNLDIYAGMGTTTIKNVTVSGGTRGVYLPKTTAADVVTFNGCTITGMTAVWPAVRAGGTSDNLGTGTLTFKNCRIFGNAQTGIQVGSMTAVNIINSLIVGNGRYALDAVYGTNPVNIYNSIMGGGSDKTINKSANYTGTVTTTGCNLIPMGLNNGASTWDAIAGTSISKDSKFVKSPHTGLVSFIVDDTPNLALWAEMADYAYSTYGYNSGICVSTYDLTTENYDLLAEKIRRGDEVYGHSRTHPIIINLNAFSIAGPANSTMTIAVDRSSSDSLQWTGTLDLKVSGVSIGNGFPLNISSVSSYGVVYQVVNKINAQSGWSCTVDPQSSNHVRSTAFAALTDQPVSVQYVAQYEQNPFWHTEVAEAKKELESGLSARLGYAFDLVSMVIPSSTANDTFRTWATTDANFAAAGTTAFKALRIAGVGTTYDLANINLNGVYGYRNNLYVDADRDIAGLLEWLGHGSAPRWVVVYGHTETLEQWRVWIDRIAQHGRVQVVGFSAYAMEIRNSGNWSGSGTVYTRAYAPGIPDYRLRPSSPCINAGTIVAGIHDQPGYTDMAGRPLRGTPDIGPYEYYPPGNRRRMGMRLGL